MTAQGSTTSAAFGRRGWWLLLAAALVTAFGMLWLVGPGERGGSGERDGIMVVPGKLGETVRSASPAGAGSLIGSADATPGRRLAEGLALAPRAVGTEGGGWVIMPDSDTGVLATHKLRAGDVLHDMDGAPLDETRIRGLGDELAVADAVEITFERQGQMRKRQLRFIE